MPQTPHTSGDPTVDRRIAHARGYAEAGEPAAAAELTEQALELAPTWAAGWFLLGEFREAAGARTGAIEAFERARTLDPSDRFGAVLRLARLGAAATPDTPPLAHVRDLFDGYAARFEESLVGRLGYRAPERLAEALTAVAGARRFARGLDLGCGTGLMARALAGRVERLEGCDLSPAMVAAARASDLYAEVEVGDVVERLSAREARSLDLVTAADVFCYLGDLGAVFAAAARALTADGVFAFSVEADGEDDTVRLGDSFRYAHGRGHLVRRAVEAGLVVAHLDRAALRRDRDADVGGFVVVFTKS
ncbi:MAG: methyltransferase domain-containing protein [Hyphomicrobiales bacterium]|nr:methyltransferase domain-containing protein [Hyphomicrobiales bacterium]